MLSMRDCDFCSVWERIYLTDTPPCCGLVRDFNAADKRLWVLRLNCSPSHCRAEAAVCCRRTLTFTFFTPCFIAYITWCCSAKLGKFLSTHDRHNLADTMIKKLCLADVLETLHFIFSAFFLCTYTCTCTMFGFSVCSQFYCLIQALNMDDKQKGKAKGSAMLMASCLGGYSFVWYAFACNANSRLPPFPSAWQASILCHEVCIQTKPQFFNSSATLLCLWPRNQSVPGSCRRRLLSQTLVPIPPGQAMTQLSSEM